MADDLEFDDLVALLGDLEAGRPEEALRAIVIFRELADDLEATLVAACRQQGRTWQEIATTLGVRRETLIRRHGARR
jgi:transcriptional regulator of acetoin/glycerol metabolism